VYYGPKENEIKTDLETGRDFLQSKNELTLEDLFEINSLTINRVSKAGLLGAVLHYLSYKNNTYPWQLLGLDEPSKIKTSFTVSIDDPDQMLREIIDSPYSIIKIKMGLAGDEILMEQLKQVSGKSLRIDANGGWSLDKAEKMIYYASRLGINIIEQPTNVEFVHEWKYLKKRANVNFLLDEGLNTLDDYMQYCDFIDGINIKMAKAGGIVEAIKLAKQAKQAKKDHKMVMLGCMVESSVSIASSVYLSSLADLFDLDGPLLLESDIADGIKYDLDNIAVDENIIGGPKIKKAYLNE
jgi:L-Ala-D/L-Glu epimerase